MTAPLVDTPAELLAQLRRVRADTGAEGETALAELGLRPLTGGMHNDLYLWTSSAGDDVVIKLYVKTDRNRVEREWAALTLLAPHGLTTVPAPLWLDHTPAEPAIGMSRLHGQPLLEATDKMAALRALAHTTARLQTVRLTGLLATLPRIDTGEHYMIRLTQTWPQMLASQADDSLAPAMRKLLTTWQRSGDADLVTTPTTPVLSRGDANLLNWMITDTGAGCVDFEYAGYSTVPFDAADLIEHISGRAVPDHIWAQVLPDLGITDANRRQFAANQRTCALRWLAVLWKQRDHRRADFDTQHARVEMLHSNDNPYT
ncbi:aminoglycoside phosphotransferase family protein [Catenuloplanes atrovinosus]|uniref:Ser/Thr protein kinase RdoA (MazF antagonist) n=1 Tax=Catenuloplanes atrovinosus TaxID=137266 RepID=A0AAE3YSB7_9ACTN|nr:aminoglycoside phosphotransferase family protein [Catenuloplanes atrovinosus]MDR7277727.1 Ser/Thr protein kinase RdoA (MazF antagonist) [Catenuloplanes atrovinosus]